MPPNQVAEIQGLYGPFTLSERVVQKIWLRQDFSLEGLTTVSGKKLIVKDPGRWNFHEGPDFKEARLVLEGAEVIGDVEVHFNLLDWRHHQHGSDRNYDNVLLHVILYLDDTDQADQVKTSKGHSPELLHLMPRLERDLESYAMDDALLELERQNELEWVARFIDQPLEARLQSLKQRALGRWQQKLTYAKQRLKAEGWEAACHSYALEVLGYARNRAPMLRLATRHPLAQIRDDLCERPIPIETGKHRMPNSEQRIVSADGLFDKEADHWKLNGLRPANHPKRRLAQYLELVRKQPYWPDWLVDCLQRFPAVSVEGGTAAFRKAVCLNELCANLSEGVFCSTIGERRFNTLVVDAILPLATAGGLLEGVDYWRHWFPGDSPDALHLFLKQAGVIHRQNPRSNGLIQGALGLFLDQGA